MARMIGDGNVIDVGVDDDPRGQQIEALKLENRRLERAVSDAEIRAERAREDADRALSNLRRQLGPLYRALQAVFGELDAAGVTEGASSPAGASPAPAGAPAVDARVQAVWDNWKQKLPGYPARIIDALLIHREMSTSQLSIACGCKSARISEGISKLKSANVINKNGRLFSLKTIG